MKTMSYPTSICSLILTGGILWSITSFASDSAQQRAGVSATFATQPGETGLQNFTPKYLADRLGLAERTTKLIGRSVRDQNKSKVGKIQDLAVDVSSGRILGVFVSTGDSAHPVLVRSKIFGSIDGSSAMLDVTKAELRDGTESTLNVESTQVTKASELMGWAVKNQVGDPLGKVVDFLVDVPTGRIIFAIVNFNDRSDGLYAVPPMAMHAIAGERALLLVAERTKIASLAHSDSFFWSGLTDTATGVFAYDNFGIRADFDVTGISDPASAAPARVESAPVLQRADKDIQHDILMALVHDSLDNPHIYQNVTFGASHGVVTLTGRVHNETQRAKLVVIVGGVVGASNVRDQLQVK